MDRALQQKLDVTSRNAFLQARMRVARSPSEFFRSAPRQADPSLALFEDHEVGVRPEFYRPPQQPVFDFDAIDAFNIQLPLTVWLEASASPALPADLRLRIAEAGWMRAVVLDRSDEARKAMEQIVALNPLYAADTAANYLAARDAKEARFGAVFIVLRTPGLAPKLDAPGLTPPDLSRPHNSYTGGQWYRHNPWTYSDEYLRKMVIYPLTFLNAADRAAAR